MRSWKSAYRQKKSIGMDPQGRMDLIAMLEIDGKKVKAASPLDGRPVKEHPTLRLLYRFEHENLLCLKRLKSNHMSVLRYPGEARMPRQKFERFYLEKVAVGEGCGCAEQAIGMRDMDARSRKLALQRRAQADSGNRWAWLRRIFRLNRPTRSSA